MIYVGIGWDSGVIFFSCIIIIVIMDEEITEMGLG